MSLPSQNNQELKWILIVVFFKTAKETLINIVLQSYFYSLKEKISEKFEWKLNIDLPDFRATPDKLFD